MRRGDVNDVSTLVLRETQIAHETSEQYNSELSTRNPIEMRGLGGDVK